MLREVLLAGDDRLREACTSMPLEEIQTALTEPPEETLGELLLDMFQTMIAEKGMGLAANQIGYLLPIFILKDETSRGYNEYINPEILSQEELVDFENEGCLSIPGVTAKTKRFRKLRLRWQDKEGTTHEDNFEDLQSFAVQHEMDHLNGRLYVDQFSPLMRSIVLKKHKKYLRNLGRK
jgi:peptide deformylase